MEVETKKFEKISLWNAVKGSCAGTKIFKKLCRHTLLRTLWHLFLMSGICSLLIVTLGKKNIESEINPQMQILDEFSGGFDNRKDGIYPKKNADKSFNFMLNDRIKVVYEPDFKEIDFRDIHPSGITWLWLPKGVFNIIKFNNDSSGNVMFFDFAALQKFKTPEIGNFKNNKELDSYMKKEYSQITPCDFSQLPCPDSDDIKTSYLFMQFLSMWVQYFWQLLITSLIFAIFYAITGVGKISNMNFKAFFSVSIYAGFPAMLVSVLFEAFKLPFIGYHTVFSFGWLIYLLVILNSFVRDREQTE